MMLSCETILQKMRSDGDATQWPTMKSAIRIGGLTKRYSESGGSTITVFEGLNLDIEAGKTTCIVGPSGCGKSTLLNIIAGLEIQDEGDLTFAPGFNSGIRGAVGYMFQRDRLLPWRTTVQNAVLGVELMDGDQRPGHEEARTLLDRFGLSGFHKAYPSELSEGMRQRVALIRTLLVRPKLLLLDEPFASVDYEVRLALENDLLQRSREQEVTIVFVSHDLETAIVLGDYVITLSARPARIKATYEIQIPRQSREALAMRQSDAFRRYFAELAKDVVRANS